MDQELASDSSKSPPPLNRYCAGAGLTSAPDLAALIERPAIKAFHLMVAVLLERGEPMMLEAIADRLSNLEVLPWTGDWLFTLKKAWGGRAPVFRDPDGRYGIDLDSRELKRLLKWRLGLIPLRINSVTEPTIVIPGSEIPLSQLEVATALSTMSSYKISTIRQVAAVLDFNDGSMVLEEVALILDHLSKRRLPLVEADIPKWRNDFIAMDHAKRLVLNRTSSDTFATRRAIRDIAQPVLLAAARKDFFAQRQSENEAKCAMENLQAEQNAAELKRAVVRAVALKDGWLFGISVIDMNKRTIETFIGAEIALAARHLDGFEVLIGLELRATLSLLNVNIDRWRLVDLKPPQKQKTLNQRGKKLKITPELLIAATSGISQPLGDPAKTARYFAEGAKAKLTRRLESDAKALLAFYSFGTLHRFVRLRWGFIDENLSVDWALPGQPGYYDILQKADKLNLPLEVVIGSAPGWQDPWSRGRRASAVKTDRELRVQLDGDSWPLERSEIQAIRIIETNGRL